MEVELILTSVIIIMISGILLMIPEPEQYEMKSHWINQEFQPYETRSFNKIFLQVSEGCKIHVGLEIITLDCYDDREVNIAEAKKIYDNFYQDRGDHI